MKILIDNIPTSDPQHCASIVKMRKIVEYTLKERDDTFFYWLVPSWANEEDRAWYPKNDRIMYLDYPYSKDRMREYNRVDRQMEDMISFQGMLWDIDIVLTNRTSAVPMMKTIMNKPSRVLLNWSKRVFLIEDMPLMAFKKTVALSNPFVQEVQTLSGYLASDTIAISAFWEKDVIMKEAKGTLAPSMLSKLRSSIVETTAVYVESTELKAKADILAQLKGERPFSIGFVGRMTKATRSEDIFAEMTKHWIFRAGSHRKVRCMLSTQSINTGVIQVPEWVEFFRLPREGFWDLVRHEMDCFIFMSPEEDYSMSLMEPLLLGCPAILIKCRWSVPSVGPEYPFFVNSISDVYPMVRAFYEDYATQYAKFAKWSKEYFEPLMLSRNSVYVPVIFGKEIERWWEGFDDYSRKTMSSVTNEITQLLIAYADENGGELVVWDAIKELGRRRVLEHLDDKMSLKFREKVKLTMATDWNLFRIGLMLSGFRDVSVNTGHMRRVT